MKRTSKRVLTAFLAALFMLGSVGFSAGAEHEHAYSAVILKEPGYVFAGEMQYVCACGDSYTELIPPRAEPYSVMTGGRIAPGGSITVEVLLYNCSGLADLTLDLAYNENWLHLEDAACAEYGDPIRVTDKALRFDAIDPTAQQALLELTFTANEDAPNGMQIVSVSGCGVSACAADNGQDIFLTMQSTAVQLYRPPRLVVNAPESPVYAGETVQMTVELVNNPGVAGMALELQYDSQALTLKNVQQEGMFTSGNVMMSGSLWMTPFRVIWDDATVAKNHTEDGTLLTLTFTVNETAAAGTTSVQATFAEGDVLDVDLQPVELSSTAAQLSIIRRIPGDADGDGELDLADAALLCRYIAGGWNVAVDEQNCDVNGDGVIDLKDVVLIRRSLAGWNVTLK